MTWMLVAAGVTLAAFTGPAQCELARIQFQPLAPVQLSCVLEQSV